MEKLEIDAKKNITSILTSSPFVVTMRELQRDYMNMIGGDIPFYKLGYGCLEEYLRAIPDTVIVNGSGPMAEVKPVITAKSAHVNQLVTNQKTQVTSKRKKGFSQKRKDFNYPGKSVPSIQFRKIHYPAGNSNMSKPSVSNSCSLPTNSVRNKVLNTNLPEPTTSQVTIQPTSKKKVESENSSIKHTDEAIVSKENISRTENVGDIGKGKVDLRHVLLSKQNVKKSPMNCALANMQSLEKKHTNVNNSMRNTHFDVDPSSVKDLEKKVPSHIKNRLRQLIRSCPEGIWCADVLDKYRLMFGHSLNFRDLGFVNLIDLFIYLSSIFHYVRPSTGDFKLYDSSKPLPDCAEKTFTIASYGSSIKKEVDFDQALPPIDWQDINLFLPDGVFRLGEEIPRVFLSHDIKEGDDIGMQVSEIFDISKFWIYLTNSLLDELMDNMQVFYRKHCQQYLLPQHLIREGLYCVQVIFGEYHRALIVDVMLQVPDAVRVVYIDYGTMTKSSTKGMCFLHDDFAKLPAQAIRCRLANLCPIEQGAPWSRECSKAFRRLVANRKLSAKISSISWDDQFFETYLADVTDGDNIFFVNDRLVEEGFAQYITKERKKPFIDPIYQPIVKYLHLFPTFLELEYGLAPSTSEIEMLLDYNIPINFCYPQYFYMEFSDEEKIIRAAESFHEKHCLRSKRKVPTRYYDLEERKILKEPDLSIFGMLEAEIKEFLNSPNNDFNLDSDDEEFEDADEDFILKQENSTDDMLEESMQMLSLQQEENVTRLKGDLLITEDIMNDINYICNIQKEIGYPETALNLLETQTDTSKGKDAKKEDEREIWTINKTDECEKSTIILGNLMNTEMDETNDDEFLFTHPLSKMTFDRYGSAEDEISSPGTPESEISAKSNNIFDLVEPDTHLHINSISESTNNVLNFDFSSKEQIETNINSKVNAISSTNPFLEDMKSNMDASNEKIFTLNPNNPFLSYLGKDNPDLSMSESSEESNSTIFKCIMEEKMQHNWNNLGELTAETIRKLGKTLRGESASSGSMELSDERPLCSMSIQTSDEQSRQSEPPHNLPPNIHPQPPPMYPNPQPFNNPYYHVRSGYYQGHPLEQQYPPMPAYRSQVPQDFRPPPGFAPLGSQIINPIANYHNQVQRFQSYPNYYPVSTYPLMPSRPNAVAPFVPNPYNRPMAEAASNIQVGGISQTTSMSSVSLSVVNKGQDFYDLYNEHLKTRMGDSAQ